MTHYELYLYSKVDLMFETNFHTILSDLGYLAWRDVRVEPGLDTVKLDCSLDTWPRGRDCALRPFLGMGIVTFCLVSLTSICSRALVMLDMAEPI